MNSSRKPAKSLTSEEKISALVKTSITVPALNIQLPSFSQYSLVDTLFKKPYREYKNPSPENENRLHHLTDDLWLEIYSHLDAHSLIKLILACKKLANLTNDDALRKKLYLAQDTQMKQRITSMKIGPQKWADYTPSHYTPAFHRQELAEHTLQIQSIKPELYNDQPTGRGFVIKR